MFINISNASAAVLNSSQALVDVLVVTNEHHNQCCSQPVTSSSCQIAALEVYRGREQAIEIRHDGFSLSDRGTVEV